jgi:hypothetical protein
MLLTAGCSFVWGDELPGFDSDPPTHWEYTWTHLLAEKLGMEYINMGMCGSCNDRIFRDVVDHLHNPDKENPTHMVVIWSAWHRQEIVEEMPWSREVAVGVNRPLEATQFSPQRIGVIGKGRRRDILSEYYDGAYDVKTDIMHDITKMKTIELLCKSLGIKLLQGTFHGRCWNNIIKILSQIPSEPTADDQHFAEYVPEYANWLKKSLSSLDDNSRIGLGRGVSLFNWAVDIDDLCEFDHPGVQTQIEYAEYLHNKFV